MSHICDSIVLIVVIKQVWAALCHIKHACDSGPVNVEVSAGIESTSECVKLYISN